MLILPSFPLFPVQANPKHPTNSTKRHSSPTSILGLPPAKKAANPFHGDSAMASCLLAGAQSTQPTARTTSSSQSRIPRESGSSPLQIEFASMRPTRDSAGSGASRRSTASGWGTATMARRGGRDRGSASISPRRRGRRSSGWDVRPHPGPRHFHSSSSGTGLHQAAADNGSGGILSGEVDKGVNTSNRGSWLLEQVLHDNNTEASNQAVLIEHHGGADTSCAQTGQSSQVQNKDMEDNQERDGLPVQHVGPPFVGVVSDNDYTGKEHSPKVQVQVHPNTNGGDTASHTEASLGLDFANSGKALAPV